MTAQRPLPRLVALATAVLFAAAATLVAAAPASAHDQLLESDPPAGATVESLPSEITLTFSGELLNLGSDEVRVTSAEGEILSEGAPIIDGSTITQALIPAEATGTITVQSRVVSGDGHVQENMFSFAVAASPAPTITPTEQSPEPTASAQPTPAPEPSTTVLSPPEPDPGIPVWIWATIGVLTIGVVGAVVALLTARARGGRRGPDPGADR